MSAKRAGPIQFVLSLDPSRSVRTSNRSAVWGSFSSYLRHHDELHGLFFTLWFFVVLCGSLWLLVAPYGSCHPSRFALQRNTRTGSVVCWRWMIARSNLVTENNEPGRANGSYPVNCTESATLSLSHFATPPSNWKNRDDHWNSLVIIGANWAGVQQWWVARNSEEQLEFLT